MSRYFTLQKEMETSYTYPEDMELILDYLNEHGEIHCSGNKIEELWRDFSEDKYCAGWMGVEEYPDKESLLDEFARWLDSQE